MTQEEENTEKKKQHFVPKLHLRNFSCQQDQENLGVYVIPSGKFLPSVPLKNQTYRTFFYGKDGRIEDGLSVLENATAPVLREVIQSKRPPAQHTDAFAKLLTFAILMYNRTTTAAENNNDILDGFIKETFKNDPRVKDDLPKIRAELKEAPAFSVTQAVESIPGAFDLHLRLLVNKTLHPLITCDNPAVYYNSFMEVRPHPGSAIGTASKGLQIFLPISPKHCLLFYDAEVYGIGDRRKLSVEITEPREIRALNLLQAVSAKELLLFNEAVDYSMIFGLMRESEYSRSKPKIEFQRRDLGTSKDGKRSSIVMCSRNELRLGLQLPFVRTLEKAKDFQPNGRLAIPRSASVGPLMGNFWEQVRKGKLLPEDLFPYLDQMLQRKAAGP